MSLIELLLTGNTSAVGWFFLGALWDIHSKTFLTAYVPFPGLTCIYCMYVTKLFRLSCIQVLVLHIEYYLHGHAYSFTTLPNIPSCFHPLIHTHSKIIIRECLLLRGMDMGRVWGGDKERFLSSIFLSVNSLKPTIQRKI